MTRATRKTEPSADPESVSAHEEALDAWLARNQDALNASIRKGMEEFARGEFDTRTTAEVIADLRRRHGNA